MNEQGFFVYHIVTRKKMKIGQSIQFNKNQTNTLFHFFFERKHLNSSGEDSIQILKEHYTNEELHIKNENATVVMNYIDQTIRAIRETIMEMVRLQEYPDYPSRLSCLYAAKSYEDALKWKALFDSYNREVLQIVKLRVIGSSFEGDGNLLPKEDAIPFSQKMEQAREYWKGNVNNELPELLINGEIEVVEIIDDFSSIHV
ncbi:MULTISPECIES: DUF2441 domain-containing protein [unclassified Bacillus cereus group]|uniref:DUF2441 domain-containing protein n=1 Tax=Bacillus cereus group TaxID=86661 RepID=UPI0009452773|nr:MULTISPECIES: DUF2441 domain-containing protein [unclassified Bacillus cereus group]MDA1545917.1 DUF2441 domain-containing protein [Bacillus cereus group sp. TH253LC]MDA1577045.1 DUF2441 domain-containing protein [Bacillus cereus group sp. TH228LC]MDA1628582.1 DUF2441 domain-containing protein [Bacillus cereus group sp. TH172LC]MDA1830583.1 DUF2441 domain-containing protein [Bacillus cereus group sp. BY142LC]MDA1835639.1 DUF2441 domain-containing protein [Bacillus cereus group sp. BY17LC]